MRYGLVIITALLFVAAFTGSCYADALAFCTPPVISVPLMSKAPNIDGLLEPGEWQQASSTSRFISLGGRSEPSAQTEMWLGYDRQRLYIAALLHDPAPDEIRAEITERDGPVSRDDCFGLFFDPANNGEQYIHLAVNSIGTRYDALNNSQDVDYRWQARVAMLESGWSVEMVLPFESGVPPSVGSIWGFMAGRSVPHLNEKSCSSRTLESFKEMENFGKIVFAQAPANMKLAALGSGGLGDNAAVVVIRNPTDAVISAKVHVRVMAPSKYGNYYGAVKIDLRPRKNSIVQVPYQIRQDGFNTVQLSLTDAQGQTITRTPPYPSNLPATGAEFVNLERTLTGALRVWAVVDDSHYKTQARLHIDALLDQWLALATQYRENRKTMSYQQLAALKVEVAQLADQARLIKQELEAYMQTQADAGITVHPVAALGDIDLTGRGGEFVPAYVEAARNSRAGLQMVISPFPTNRRAA